MSTSEILEVIHWPSVENRLNKLGPSKWEYYAAVKMNEEYKWPPIWEKNLKKNRYMYIYN